MRAHKNTKYCLYFQGYYLGHVTRPVRKSLVYGNGLQQASHLITQPGQITMTTTAIFAIFMVLKSGLSDLIQKGTSSVNTLYVVRIPVDSNVVSGVIFENHKNVLLLTRFNNIAIQGKGPDGKWTRKLVVYRQSNMFNLCVTHSPEICVNLVF